MQAISDLPDVEDHGPDIDVRGDGVTVRLITYTDDYYGMSRRDIELARQISAAARKLGLSARLPARINKPNLGHRRWQKKRNILDNVIQNA